VLDEPEDSCPSTAAGAGAALACHHSNSFARNRRTLVGDPSRWRLARCVATSRVFAPREPRKPLVSAPLFSSLIVNGGSHAERWYRLYGERSKRVYIAYCRSTWNQKPNATSCNPPNPPNVTNKTRKSNLKPTPANARETRNPKPMGGANYTGKWQDKDGRAGRGRPKWTFRARSARPSQSPAGHREF
jgi:hypothetical protein